MKEEKRREEIRGEHATALHSRMKGDEAKRGRHTPLEKILMGVNKGYSSSRGRLEQTNMAQDEPIILLLRFQRRLQTPCCERRSATDWYSTRVDHTHKSRWTSGTGQAPQDPVFRVFSFLRFSVRFFDSRDTGRKPFYLSGRVSKKTRSQTVCKINNRRSGSAIKGEHMEMVLKHEILVVAGHSGYEHHRAHRFIEKARTMVTTIFGHTCGGHSKASQNCSSRRKQAFYFIS